MRRPGDRPDLEPTGRSRKLSIRHALKGELPLVREVIETAFAELRDGGPGARPRPGLGGAQFVHHRALMEPLGCFVAQDESTGVVGAGLGVTWGSVGVLGPVGVLASHQNQGVGRQLVRAIQGFFEQRRTVLQGLVTDPVSAKNLSFYHRQGYRPKGLVAITSRRLEGDVGATPPTHGTRTGLTVGRVSGLDERRKRAALARFRKITAAVCRGLDLGKEVEIVDGLALGDTLLLEQRERVLGFAVCHTPGVSEAPTGALYVKFLALSPEVRRVEILRHFLAGVEDFARELGLGRAIVPVYTRYGTAYDAVLEAGYGIDFTMVRMQRGRLQDHEDPAHLVLDDWR